MPDTDTAKAFHRRNQFPFGNAAVILPGRLLCLLFPTSLLCMDFIPFLSPDLKEHNNWCFLRGFNNSFFLIVYFFLLAMIWSEPLAQTSKIQVLVDESTLLIFCDIGSCYSNGLPQISPNGSGVWLLSTSARWSGEWCLRMEMGKIP